MRDPFMTTPGYRPDADFDDAEESVDPRAALRAMRPHFEFEDPYPLGEPLGTRSRWANALTGLSILFAFTIGALFILCSLL